MDNNLEERYWLLFATYDAEGSPLVAQAKALIMRRLVASPLVFRADAAHFLLVNFDHMVIRPMSGLYAGQDIVLGVPSELAPPIPGEQMPMILDRVLSEILDALDDGGEPVSAHRVLLAIDRAWRQIGDRLSWS